MTGWYSWIMGAPALSSRGFRDPFGLRVEERQEILHGAADRLEVHQVGKRRTLMRLGGLLDVLAEPADPPAPGVDVAVDDQVKRVPGLLELLHRQIEVAGARLPVGEHEQKLVVL